MNISITTSFVVGGLLMISILTLNNQLMQSSADTTLSMQAKTHVASITQILSNDISKIGFNVPSSANNASIFVQVRPEKFAFRGDVFNEGTPHVITWELTNTEYSKGGNPNDYELVRKGPIEAGGNPSTRLVFPATYLDITYLDAEDDPIANPQSNKDIIRRIQVKLICEATDSPRNTAGNDQYPESVWTRKFIPNTLQFRVQ